MEVFKQGTGATNFTFLKYHSVYNVRPGEEAFNLEIRRWNQKLS